MDSSRRWLLHERRAHYLLACAGVPEPTADEVAVVAAAARLGKWDAAQHAAEAIASFRGEPVVMD